MNSRNLAILALETVKIALTLNLNILMIVAFRARNI